jgi:hypothetical protein
MPKDIVLDHDRITAVFAADGMKLVAGIGKFGQQELSDYAGRSGDDNTVP